MATFTATKPQSRFGVIETDENNSVTIFDEKGRIENRINCGFMVLDYDVFDFIDEIKPVHVLVTDISKDGMMTGPNYDLYSFLKSKFPHLKIIASGGIRDINDIQKLISIKIEHAVIGKAIYEEKIELMELLNVN